MKVYTLFHPVKEFCRWGAKVQVVLWSVGEWESGRSRDSGAQGRGGGEVMKTEKRGLPEDAAACNTIYMYVL